MARAQVALFTLLALACALMMARSARADEAPVEPSIELYTVGPAADLYSRWGHSALCVMTKKDAGDCYDFGVPNPVYADNMVRHSLAGKPIFVTVRVPYAVMLSTFQNQERSIEKQKLPLSPQERDALIKALEESAARGDAYAYHPVHATCSTRVRDIINDNTGNRLKQNDSTSKGPTLRELCEEGLSGHLLELAALALVANPSIERQPGNYEAMLLPTKLRDGVEARFGAKPEKVHDREMVRLPTSTGVGRGLFVFLGFGLMFLVHWASRPGAKADGRTKLALRVVGLTQGGMGAVIALVSFLCAYPETRRNWVMLVLLPTDVALGFLPKHLVKHYALGRLIMLAALVVLEIAGVAQQRVIPIALFVGLPMLAAYLIPKTKAAPTAPAVAAPAQSSP